MAYKTILVHVEHSQLMKKCVETAAALANAEQAHLVGAAMVGISRYAYVDHQTLFEKAIQELVNQAQESLDRFENICRQQGVASFERRLIHDEPAAGITLQMPYADLAVVGQTAQTIHLVADLSEYVMLNSARPVLVIPHSGPTDILGAPALLAWNGSQEAVRAASFALPLLKRAKNVTVALFRSASAEDGRDDQMGADVALWLTRHGVQVDVVEDQSGKHADDGLLALAAARETRLIVMGGYGHARAREVLLGGVTLNVLQNSTVPVLIAH